MQKALSKTNLFLCSLLAIISCSSIFIQFYLIIINRVASIPETIIRFFSFFTIQTNILVAICFTFLWLKPKSKIGTFFLVPNNITGVALYIIIVGLIYNTILRFLWQPEGLQRVLDEMLHLVNPLLVLLYWIVIVNKAFLKFAIIARWLLFPAFYLFYVLVRGQFSGFYPYPFMNVAVLGYGTVFFNSFCILLAFLIVGFLLVGFAKIKTNKSLN